MRLALYTPVISPHQLPLAERIVSRVGADNFLYIYTQEKSRERLNLGWGKSEDAEKIRKVKADTDEAHEWLENADVLIVGNCRPLPLIRRRAMNGHKSFYQTERWFKPPLGMLRMVWPPYFKMAIRFYTLLRNNQLFECLPMGVHAARDMARLCGLFAGDLRCLFRAPELRFERKPCGKIWSDMGGDEKRYCLDKMRMWGYYVEPSKFDSLPVQEANKSKPHEIKVLWVGRLLSWKRVDTIVRAVGAHEDLRRADDSLPKITLDIYGTGPEEARLKKLAAKYGDVVRFYPPVPIDEVRGLMRKHDIYVLASNAYEGWGAVLSEALEEGVKVIGTYEAGSSGTILFETNLFHAGDWRGLMSLLINGVPLYGIGKWTAKDAAKELVDLSKKESDMK